MVYKLHELTKRVPGVVGDQESKPVPRLSPAVQRELTLQLDLNEGFTTEYGTPKSHRAEVEMAARALREAGQG
jgi:hypothetical protein